MGIYDIAGGMQDPTANLTRGYKLGQDIMQTQQQGKLASLAAQAYAAPDGQSGPMIQQAMALDPTTGMQVDNKINERHEAMVKQAAGAANYFVSAVQTGDEAKIKGAWQSVRPTIAQLSADHNGPTPPEDIDMATAQSMLPNAYKLIAAAQGMGGEQQQMSPHVIGSALVDSTGKVLYQGEEKVDTGKWEIKQDKDGNVYRINPQTNQAEPMYLGGQPQASANNPSAGLSGSTPGMYRNSIASIESKGSGDYSAMGPLTKTGDRAYGKYQVMGANIPQWTKDVLGTSMTPEQFIASPQAQDAVFDNKFGGYVGKYGAEGAARAWFGGPGNVNNPNARDVNGMSVGQYGEKFAQTIGGRQRLNLGGDRADSRKAPSGYRYKSDGTSLEPIPGGPADKGQEATAPGDTTQTGDAYLKTLPAQQSAQVKALAEGRMNFPSGTALKSPYWQAMLSAVSQYDPNFDAVNYNARAKTRADFTSGKSANNIKALNTLAGHIAGLQVAVNELGGTDSTDFNAIRNFYLNHTGDDRVSKLDAARTAVANELTTVFRGSSGAEADVQGWLKQLDSAKSPKQLNTVIREVGGLVESRIQALQDNYEQGMGTTQSGRAFVTPVNQRFFDELRGGKPSAHGSSGPPSITTQAQFDALPRGATYLEDGKTYRKP